MKGKKPNILIIISDQQNIDAIAAYKSQFKDKAYHCHWIKTPHMDKLVYKGYSFMESHCVNPVSGPARGSLFTGRYSVETGMFRNNIGIDKLLPNMGQWFESNADYRRLYCGKWHAGGMWSYPDVEGPRKIPGFETIPVGVTATGDYNDFQVAGALSGFIRNNTDDKPFLAVAGLMNPHDICYWIPVLWGERLVAEDDHFNLQDKRPPLPPNHDIDFEEPFAHSKVDYTTDQWKNYLYDYQRMIERLDTDIGRLVEAVESRKDDTLIIVTSDHGDGAARHKRVQKWHPFEQAVKVPLIFYLPGKVKEHVIDDTNIVTGLDIMPTVCDFAGIPSPPNCRGNSLKDIVEGKPSSTKHDLVICEILNTTRMVRHGDFKYVKHYRYSGDREKPFVRKSDGISEKFVQCDGRERYEVMDKSLLFNIKEDPWETTNLADDPEYSAIIKKLDEVLAVDYEQVVIPGTNYDRN